MKCEYHDTGRCRSCTLMGTPYATQLDRKAATVRSVLGPHTDTARWLAPVTSPESHFRNKAKLVVGGRPTDPTLGILDRDGRGQDLRRCGLYEPGLAATFDPLHGFLSEVALEPYEVPRRRGELKHVIVTHSPDGEHLVRFVVRAQDAVRRLRRALPHLFEVLPSAKVVTANVLPEHKAVLEGDLEVPLTHQTLLPMRLGRVPLHLGPRAFFQTNTHVARTLYAQAREWADAVTPNTVLDLYCGVGGFALHLAAPGRHIVGVESSAEAVAAAVTSAETLDVDHGPVEFVVGDATTTLPDVVPDLVVVNPPRRGIGPDLARRLDGSAASHLVYSSCNPESLARDLAAMPSWRAVEARVVDMFPQTRHVEVALLLARDGARGPAWAASSRGRPGTPRSRSTTGPGRSRPRGARARSVAGLVDLRVQAGLLLQRREAKQPEGVPRRQCPGLHDADGAGVLVLALEHEQPPCGAHPLEPGLESVDPFDRGLQDVLGLRHAATVVPGAIGRATPPRPDGRPRRWARS